MACHLFSGECHWFKLDCKFIKHYLAIICWYWFFQCLQVCSKVRLLALMKKEYVWLVQVKRFHRPIGVFLSPSKRWRRYCLASLSPHFSTVPASCFAQNSHVHLSLLLFCMVVERVAMVGIDRVHRWAVAVGFLDDCCWRWGRGHLIALTFFVAWNVWHYYGEWCPRMQERCIPCCTRKRPIRMDTTVCIRCVFYAGYHGIMLQATTATTAVVERRQDTTSKSLKIHATLPQDSWHTTLKTAFHKSIYERQSLPFMTIQ